MKKLFICVALAAAMFTIASCEKDEKEDNSTSNNVVENQDGNAMLNWDAVNSELFSISQLSQLMANDGWNQLTPYMQNLGYTADNSNNPKHFEKKVSYQCLSDQMVDSLKVRYAVWTSLTHSGINSGQNWMYLYNLNDSIATKIVEMKLGEIKAKVTDNMIDKITVMAGMSNNTYTSWNEAQTAYLTLWNSDDSYPGRHARFEVTCKRDENYTTAYYFIEALNLENYSFGRRINLSYGITENTPDVSSTLMAYYSFENNGDDLSGNNHSGSFSGIAGVNYITGAKGQAVHLDHNSVNAFEIPFVFFKDIRRWTVSFWAKDLTAGAIFSCQNLAITEPGDVPRLYADPDNSRLKIRMDGYGTQGVFNYDYTQNSAAWHHYVIAMDSTDYTGASLKAVMKLYVDGQLKDNINCSYSPGYINGCSKTVFGGSRGNSYPNIIDIKLDEVRIYSRTLKDDEVARLYELVY
ncbi:MAG: hypothetical protein AUK63_1551 [bacterium P3]|nr:MAG: hypothetical protein AUK63_1551 [bacterium P3]KWW41053.1 MAG: hypothetical protein F083_1220 [bacterium F083]